MAQAAKQLRKNKDLAELAAQELKDKEEEKNKKRNRSRDRRRKVWLSEDGVDFSPSLFPLSLLSLSLYIIFSFYRPVSFPPLCRIGFGMLNTCTITHTVRGTHSRRVLTSYAQMLIHRLCSFSQTISCGGCRVVLLVV